MANEWAEKKLPTGTDGKERPAVFDDAKGDNGEWEVVKGRDGRMWVRDDGVESRLKSIEDQNKKIIERLDGTFDTKLTGSNVEDGIPVKQVGEVNLVEEVGTGVEVPANSSTDVDSALTEKELLRFTNFNIMGRADASHSWRISMVWESRSRGGISGYRERVTIGESDGVLSPTNVEMRFVYQRVRFRVENRSDDDHTYNFEVFWRS